jgi:putative transposase
VLEFRVHTALAQISIHLSPRTCGCILALNRVLYGLEKPKGGSGRRRTMPFASGRQHELCSADVRYLGTVDENRLGGRPYVVAALENHRCAIQASAASHTQDLSPFLSTLHRTVERHGLPKALVSDGGASSAPTRQKKSTKRSGLPRER